MSDFGIKITKPGYDTKTAAIKDQVFNSEYNSLKIWMTGNVSISVSEWDGLGGGGVGSSSVAHNLAYEPFFLTYFKLSNSGKLWLQDSLDDDLLFNIFVASNSYVDTTNLVMSITTNGNARAAWTAYCYYIILIDKAYE